MLPAADLLFHPGGKCLNRSVGTIVQVASVLTAPELCRGSSCGDQCAGWHMLL